MNHATVKLGDHNIPLIGISQDATLEICDECGDYFGISQIELWIDKFYCRKCLEIVWDRRRLTTR